MKRKHADLIIAWANGAAIQYRKDERAMWVDCDDPAWIGDYEYRVKPKEAERVYPQTMMTGIELELVWMQNYPNMGEATGRTLTDCRRACANEVLRHAIDNGQVVTREEFDRVTHELKRAQDTLRSAGYTDHGFQIWPPPIGNGYAECQADCSKTVAATVEAVSAFIERVNYPPHWNCTPKGIANAVRKAHELGKIMSVQEIDQ